MIRFDREGKKIDRIPHHFFTLSISFISYSKLAKQSH